MGRFEQHVVLNTATSTTGVGVKPDGVYEAWVDGVKVYSANNWTYRINSSLKVDHISFIWWYGGNATNGAQGKTSILFRQLRCLHSTDFSLSSGTNRNLGCLMQIYSHRLAGKLTAQTTRRYLVFTSAGDRANLPSDG